MSTVNIKNKAHRINLFDFKTPVVPFINKKALGSVAGIVGAGGNFGAVMAGFLFRSEALTWPEALFILGVIVTICSSLTIFVTFSKEAEAEVKEEHDRALVARRAANAAGAAALR